MNTEAFVNAFKAMQDNAHRINEEHGFNDPDKHHFAVCDPLGKDYHYARIGLKLALIHSELSEGLEAVRKGIDSDDHIPSFTGLEAELADAIIRIMNLASDENLRLADAIVEKMAYNDARLYKHGNKKF